MTLLPPNVSAVEFASAMRGFELAVGKEWGLSSETDIAGYRDPGSMVRDKPGELLPSASLRESSKRPGGPIMTGQNKMNNPRENRVLAMPCGNVSGLQLG